MNAEHYAILAIEGVGPMTYGQLLSELRTQFNESLQAIPPMSRVYSYTEDGVVWYTTAGEDPR